MMVHLAQLIVSDGEGASKFIEYEIVNAPNEEYARTMIRKISDSALVKTAMFGRDPNWGRIVSAAGNDRYFLLIMKKLTFILVPTKNL